MARSTFFGGRSEDSRADGSEFQGYESASGSAPTQASTPGPAKSLSAFIDQGSEFEGKLTFKDTVRIDGVFRGEIASENTLVVGETGEIEATVRSRNVLVSGTVTGNVFAAERLVLHKSARVQGDVEAGLLQMEEGAILNGQLRMSGAAKRPMLAAAPAPAPDPEPEAEAAAEAAVH